MVEQAAAAGCSSLAALVPEVQREELPGRDYRGYVRPPVVEVASPSVESLAADYDLGTAVVRHLRVERAGDRLVGRLGLMADRLFPVDLPVSLLLDSSNEPVELDVWLRDINSLRFDSADDRGVVLLAESGRVSVSIGAHGILRAGAAEYWCHDDPFWHQSAAGRRADAVTPPRGSERPRADSPGSRGVGSAGSAACALLYRAMIELRMVRFTGTLPQVPPSVLLRTFSGAGAAILDAGAHCLPRRRQTAYRRLIDTWVERGGLELAEWFASAVGTVPLQRGSAVRVLERIRVGRGGCGLPGSDPDVVVDGDIGECELRLASYAPAHERYGKQRDAVVVVHLAVPGQEGNSDASPWEMRVVEVSNPSRFELRIEAFQHADRPDVVPEDDGSNGFSLHDGALFIA